MPKHNKIVNLVWNQTSLHVDDHVKIPMWEQIYSQVSDKVMHQIRDQIRCELRGQINTKLYFQIRKQIQIQVDSNLLFVNPYIQNQIEN